MPGTPLRPNLKGFSVRNPQGAPLVFEYPVAAASAEIRPGDPVKEIAGGIIQKGAAADTVILGFALEPNIPGNYVAREIPIAPVKTDANGLTLIRVAVAGGGNIFTAATKGAPAQANVTKTFDLIADPDNANGFVIENTAAGTVNTIQIVGIEKSVKTPTRVDFVVPQSKSQFVGVAGA